MLVQIEAFFMNRPERIIALGRSLAYLGWTLIMLALLGNVAKVATGAVWMLGGRASTTKTLADIYPYFPTWWIPESIVGAVPAILMLAVGLTCMQLGKRIILLMKNF